MFYRRGLDTPVPFAFWGAHAEGAHHWGLVSNELQQTVAEDSHPAYFLLAVLEGSVMRRTFRGASFRRVSSQRPSGHDSKMVLAFSRFDRTSRA